MTTRCQYVRLFNQSFVGITTVWARSAQIFMNVSIISGVTAGALSLPGVAEAKKASPAGPSCLGRLGTGPGGMAAGGTQLTQT